MKIILYNGPPSSGKDSAAKYLYEKYNDVIFERFSSPLKRAFAAITGRNINDYFEVDYYEDHKEEVIPWLGVSYRQWQIDFSEKFSKPLYGKDIFGKLFIERLNSYRKHDTIVVPDSGFSVEIDLLEKAVDPKNVLLIRCHREGFCFSNDSRKYVYSDKFLSMDIYNRDLNRYLYKIENIFNYFVNDDTAALERVIMK